MAMSNIEYSELKKKAGLHNWGFISSKNKLDFDFEIEELAIPPVYSPEVFHQNSFGESYALQDFEE